MEQFGLDKIVSGGDFIVVQYMDDKSSNSSEVIIGVMEIMSSMNWSGLIYLLQDVNLHGLIYVESHLLLS